MTKDLQGIYICDMGISRLKDMSKTTMTTGSNSPIGTSPYMAPELFSKGHHGTAVDIYAFGCLLIEVFGEQRVWKGLNGPQIMQKVCGTFNCAPMPPLVAHLPLFISSVCSACCELEPANRPSITVAAEMLNNINFHK